LPTQAEIRAQLTGPGGPFELRTENVLGESLEVFANRKASLGELLSQSALHADSEYIVMGDRRISYAEHARLVASAARALKDRYGIQKGDRVAILAANCPEWVIAFWATVSLGAIVSALNGWWTRDEIEYGLSHSEPKLLIADRRRLERAGTAPGAAETFGVPTLEIETGFAELESHAADAALPEPLVTEDDPALILYTSGTTGRPKGAVVSHRAILGFVQTNALNGLERILMAAADGAKPPAEPPPPPCALVTSPLFHLSGLYALAVMMLATGAKTVYRAGRFDPADVLRIIEQERVTIWSALGSMGPLVLAEPSIGDRDLSSLRNIGFGGAPTSPALQEKVRAAFPNAAAGMGLGYGLSESGGLCASIGGRELEQRPSSVGRPSPGHAVEIRDAEGKSLPEGQNGEIHIRSPFLMLEYWRNPEATAEALKSGRWLATGDIGRLEDGYLYIDSRARDLILRAAENIYPVEVEHRLDAHPSVGECAVVGVDHEILGQEVKAIVVPAAGAEIDEAELASWVGDKLAAYKVPSIWEMRREALPRNAAGKVLKNVLTGEAESNVVDE
jgi:long-chain acyl-CoA synthetase